MSAARPDFTADRRRVLELARDAQPVPTFLRAVALSLEHPRLGSPGGFLEWQPGLVSFRLTPEGAALLEAWKGRGSRDGDAPGNPPFGGLPAQDEASR